VSAALGAVLATWVWQGASKSQVQAQEPVRSLTSPAGSDSVRGVAASPQAVSPSHVPDSQPVDADPTLSEFTPEERVNIWVYERVNRGVVHIMTKAASGDSFFSLEEPAEGSGSGSVLDQQGHILTNFHVIEGASAIRVTLFDGQSYDASLVGRDAANDVAVLKIDAPRDLLFPIELGDSSTLRVGQRVFAIGNPFGLERTLTVGTLSSLNRRLPSRTGRDMKSIIQVDAALNRGNSGGPLLNSRGLLIGMNTAIASSTGENTGVGFSIPVNTVKRVVPQLIERGRVIRPVIGIASVFESKQGLVVIELVPGGPAERAGLRGFRLMRKKERRGPFVYERQYVDREYADIIVAAEGKPVRTGDELMDLVESKKPGDRLVVRVLREGRELDVAVVLGSNEGQGVE
jgi:S1-C subfamily serine protease